jgi:hypothetical protein
LQFPRDAVVEIERAIEVGLKITNRDFSLTLRSALFAALASPLEQFGPFMSGLGQNAKNSH